MNIRPTAVDHPFDQDGERASEWLTYAEAGNRLGVSAEAARQMALRRRWPKRKHQQIPNGPVQILVPHDVEHRTVVRTPVDQVDKQVSDARSNVEIDALGEAVSLLKEQLERERGRADVAEATRVKAEEDVATERKSRLDAEQRAAQAEQQAALDRAALMVEKAARERVETAAGKWDAWLASGLGARLKAVFWKA